MSYNIAVRKLKHIKRELTALKTAHDRPLGTLDFFHANKTFTVNLTSSYGVYVATVNIVVQIETPTVTPPIVQTGWDTPNGFYRVQFLDFSVNNLYNQWTYKLQLIAPGTTITTADMKITSISSQPITSITWSYA